MKTYFALLFSMCIFPFHALFYFNNSFVPCHFQLIIYTVGLQITCIAASDQYHIQTDEGPERYFRFQTHNGQFRKEKRLQDGTVIGKRISGSLKK